MPLVSSYYKPGVTQRFKGNQNGVRSKDEISEFATPKINGFIYDGYGLPDELFCNLKAEVPGQSWGTVLGNPGRLSSFVINGFKQWDGSNTIGAIPESTPLFTGYSFYTIVGAVVTFRFGSPNVLYDYKVTMAPSNTPIQPATAVSLAGDLLTVGQWEVIASTTGAKTAQVQKVNITAPSTTPASFCYRVDFTKLSGDSMKHILTDETHTGNTGGASALGSAFNRSNPSNEILMNVAIFHEDISVTETAKVAMEVVWYVRFWQKVVLTS